MAREFSTMEERGKEKNMPKGLKFAVYKPGGNDTGLFEGVIRDVTQRKLIADALMKEYPNVEQVGFVNLDPNNTELMMTGGEFCGNATRSTAYAALKGKPGEVMVRVSGVRNKLRAGVTQNGEAFSQMPIYKEASRITPDSDGSGNMTVEMEGITHYIDFNTRQIKGLSGEELKAKSREMLREKCIDKGPACGIIFSEKDGSNWKITPVVYVRDADTLYCETACGSGTTALGLTLALKEDKSIKDVPIVQPTGMPIKFSVDFNGKEFGYAQIQGPVQKLVEGEQVIDKEGPYIVEQITSREKLNQALNEQGLIKLYQDVFSKYPYLENFSDEDVTTFFNEYFNDGRIFVARHNGQVIAFGASLPVGLVPQIDKIVSDAGVDTSNCWYMADVGVNELYRRRGIALRMVQKRIEAASKDSLILMRTSVNNIPSQNLYRSLGFTDVPGAFEYVNTEKFGEPRADKRLFLIRNRN